jgi:hypothetical protein
LGRGLCSRCMVGEGRHGKAPPSAMDTVAVKWVLLQRPVRTDGPWLSPAGSARPPPPPAQQCAAACTPCAWARTRPGESLVPAVPHTRTYRPMDTRTWSHTNGHTHMDARRWTRGMEHCTLCSANTHTARVHTPRTCPLLDSPNTCSCPSPAATRVWNVPVASTGPPNRAIPCARAIASRNCRRRVMPSPGRAVGRGRLYLRISTGVPRARGQW